MRLQECFQRGSGIVVALAIAAGTFVPSAQARHATRSEDGTGQPPTRIITVHAADTFDWSDATIGGAGVMGTALAAGGSLLLLRRHQQRKPAQL